MAKQLGDIRIPTLILCGRHDWITPVVPAAERLHDGLPSATLSVFGQSGHYPFMEENSLFIDVVESWLARSREGTLA
jgi:proline iminopeptidase